MFNTTTNSSWPVRDVDPIFQMVAYTVIGVTSLTCNISFLYVIFFTYKMKAHQTSLLVNLAFSDICIILVGIPLTLLNLASKQPITQGILCQTQGFLLLMLFLHSNFNLTYIALQRYLIVVRTKFYPTEMTRTKSALQIITTWTCASVVALPSLLGWGKQDYNFGRAHCMLVWGHSISYLLFVQFTAFTIPLVIIIFSYYNIIRYSKRTVVKVKDNPEMKASRKIREYRLSMTLIIVVVTFFTLFMPYATMLYYEGFGGSLANEVIILSFLFSFGEGQGPFFLRESETYIFFVSEIRYC